MRVPLSVRDGARARRRSPKAGRSDDDADRRPSREVLGPVLARVVGALAARREVTIDRLSDAMLLTDAISADAPGGVRRRQGADRPQRRRRGDRPRGSARWSPAPAERLRRGLELPEVGGSLEKLADELKVEENGDGEYLLVRFAAGAPASRSAPARSRSSSSIRSRIRCRVLRRMRETCICECPIRSAICDWVMSSTKRSRRTSRSRSLRWGIASSSAIRPSISSKPSSSSPIHSDGGDSSASSRGARAVERERAAVVVGLEDLEHVRLVELHPLGDLAHRRRPLQLAGQLGDRLVDLGHPVVQAARHAHRPDAVAEVALQLAEDRRRGEGRERRAALGVEAVDRVDQAEAGDLDQVVGRLAGAAVAHCQPLREGQVAAHQLLADLRIAGAGEARPELLSRELNRLAGRRAAYVPLFRCNLPRAGTPDRATRSGAALESRLRDRAAPERDTPQ